jgi:isochorismate hydrolase
MIKNRYTTLSQELVDRDRSVQARYRAATSTVQSCATLAKHVGCVVAAIHDLTRRKNEFLMDDAIAVEEGDQHCLDLGLLQATLFGSRGRR